MNHKVKLALLFWSCRRFSKLAEWITSRGHLVAKKATARQKRNMKMKFWTNNENSEDLQAGSVLNAKLDDFVSDRSCSSSDDIWTNFFTWSVIRVWGKSRKIKEQQKESEKERREENISENYRSEVARKRVIRYIERVKSLVGPTTVHRQCRVLQLIKRVFTKRNMHKCFVQNNKGRSLNKKWDLRLSLKLFVNVTVKSWTHLHIYIYVHYTSRSQWPDRAVQYLFSQSMNNCWS